MQEEKKNGITKKRTAPKIPTLGKGAEAYCTILVPF